MRLPILLSSVLLAVAPFAAANPVAHADPHDDTNWDGHDGHSPRYGCLSDHSARLLVSKFEQFFVKIDPIVAKKYLTKDFQVFSDSTNYVSPNATHTPGVVTFGSRKDFISGQQGQQLAGPQPTFTTLNIWHSCDTITFRWHLNMPPTAVTGIDVLVIEHANHLIQTDYSEFNNVVLLTDFGCKITGC